jgi:hypothetical protein
MPVVFLMLIAFWAPNATQPVRVEHSTFATEAECDAYALKRDAEWDSTVHGGSTSWLCVGAFPGPST